jgi:hypothetical protein
MRYLSTSARPNSAKKTLAVRMGLMKFSLVCSLMLYDSVSYPQPQPRGEYRGNGESSTNEAQTRIDRKAKGEGCEREDAQAHVP